MIIFISVAALIYSHYLVFGLGKRVGNRECREERWRNTRDW